MSVRFVAFLVITGLMASMGASWLVDELLVEPDERDAPIVAMRTAPERIRGIEAERAACRRHGSSAAVSEATRREIRRICSQAAKGDLEEAQAGTLAACLLVARQTGDLEGCGFTTLNR